MQAERAQILKEFGKQIRHFPIGKKKRQPCPTTGLPELDQAVHVKGCMPAAAVGLLPKRWLVNDEAQHWSVG
jgi:hypothetical protein